MRERGREKKKKQSMYTFIYVLYLVILFVRLFELKGQQMKLNLRSNTEDDVEKNF